MKTTLAAVLAAALAAPLTLPLEAEEQKPASRVAVSPRATEEIAAGTGTLRVEYSRPFVKGRKIFGGLVPYGQVWRTGANAATTFVAGVDVTLGTTPVPKGTYTLYTLPGEKSWTLVVSKQTGQWGTQYDQAQDFARIDLKVEPLPQPVEQFLITLEASGPNAGRIVLEWENTRLSAPIAVK